MRGGDLGGMIVATALGLVLAGCGGADKPVTVTGVVTVNGEPVVGAMVTFLPEGEAGRLASAITGTGGTFRLTTWKPHDGALPGAYKVTVQYQEAVEAPAATNMRQAMQGMERARANKPVPPKYVIPTRYSDPGQTVLRQTVPTSGTVSLELTSP
jgi:hypothetical protein